MRLGQDDSSVDWTAVRAGTQGVTVDESGNLIPEVTVTASAQPIWPLLLALLAVGYVLFATGRGSARA